MGSSKGNTKGNNRVYNQIETLIRIKKVLQENGIDTSTQTEIGKYFGVVPSAISNWANDNKPIGLEKLIKVSSDFNVSLDWLVFGIEQSKEAPAETKKEPDSVEPVQTKKNIEDYTILDICKGIAALTCRNDIDTEITIQDNIYDFSYFEYALNGFDIHIQFAPITIFGYSQKTIDDLYMNHQSMFDLFYFLKQLRPMAPLAPYYTVYKKELLEKIELSNGISPELRNELITQMGESLDRVAEILKNCKPKVTKVTTGTTTTASPIRS